MDEAYKLKSHIDSILKEINKDVFTEAKTQFILENKQRLIDKIERLKRMCIEDSEIEYIQTVFGNINKSVSYTEKTLGYKLDDMFNNEWYRKDNPLKKDILNKSIAEIEKMLTDGMEPQEIIKLITCIQQEVT